MRTLPQFEQVLSVTLCGWVVLSKVPSLELAFWVSQLRLGSNFIWTRKLLSILRPLKFVLSFWKSSLTKPERIILLPDRKLYMHLSFVGKIIKLLRKLNTYSCLYDKFLFQKISCTQYMNKEINIWSKNSYI